MFPKINETFRPDIAMKNLYYIYLLSVAAISCLSWMIPAIVASFLYLRFDQALTLALALLSPLMAGILFTVFWIPKFYSSIKYTLTNDEIIVEKGVYWKRKGFVPYNRITNINIIQGPLARRFELGTIRIQTAGFSTGGGTHTAEAVILNVRKFEELKDTIMNFVRKLKPVAVEAEAEALAPENVDKQILDELRKIRKSLETSASRKKT